MDIKLISKKEYEAPQCDKIIQKIKQLNVFNEVSRTFVIGSNPFEKDKFKITILTTSETLGDKLNCVICNQQFTIRKRQFDAIDFSIFDNIF